MKSASQPFFVSSRKGREREERCLTTKERPRADLGVSRRSLDHHFCLKFRIIFSRILSKIKSIYIAGKCPGHPFLNFLDPPLNASPLYSAKASLCRREAGEKEKERTRRMMGSPRAFYFSVIAIFIGTPSGSLCGGERCFIQTSENQ